MYYFILPHKLIFNFPAGTSRGVYTERQVWYIFLSEQELSEELCKNIIADPRLLSICNVGVGEIAPLYDLSCEYCADFNNLIKACCEEFIRHKSTSKLSDYPSIRFGLETALRSLSSPDGLTFYYNSFTRGKTGTPINGLVWMGDKATMRQRMQSKLEAGFTCVKLKIGALNWDEELELLKELRQFAPAKDLQIRVDANGAFSESNALTIMHQLADLEIHSIEQPIRAGNWEALSRLCAEAPLPIALDEELIGINDTTKKMSLLREVNPSYIVLKPTLHGGFEGTKEWIKLATDAGIGYWITSALESNIGLNAIAQFTSTLPTGDFAQGLGTGQLFVENIPHIGLTIKGNKLYRNQVEDREDLEANPSLIAPPPPSAPSRSHPNPPLSDLLLR
ncbi:MAG: o-succinylbenzoate synthase [Bacteroidaceae bacterium]|nr:o-succinylbenzoate synthase [Bacteroidaceae bacterium]